MVYLSKSKYCGLWQCPKIAWLRKYKPEKIMLDDSVLSRMNAGNEVGDLAMQLFGDYIEVTAYSGDSLDLEAMIQATAEEMKNGTENICEASFEYNGLYCAVDILRKQDDGWAIYEVKSSSVHDGNTEDKPVYIADISYQKYVLEHCGVNLKGTYLVCINGDYVRGEELELNRLFTVSDVSEEVSAEEKGISARISEAEILLSSENEPEIDLSLKCRDPYPCAFWDYCTRDIPDPSVFDLYRMPFKNKIELYKNGKISFQDLKDEPKVKNEKQKRQIEYYLEDKGTFVDRDGIKQFINTLYYPLYFLDFETIQPVIPQYPGTHPYEQIPFQYSLHYIEEGNGELKHLEFLAESGPDPRRSVAEHLCHDIPMNVCVTAYNKAFECTRIKELADCFPDLADHLLNIKDHIIDLLIPFQSGYYYNRAMGGSFSIKSVLPAIFPDDPSLNYHNLTDIHNGSEAMNKFPEIEFLSEKDKEAARTNLLRYCELDTYAMVKIWDELIRVAETHKNI